MKIFEILEAKPVSLGGGFSSQLKQRIDPKTLQAVADLRKYKSDADKLKPKELVKPNNSRTGPTTDDSYTFNNVHFNSLGLKITNDTIEKLNRLDDMDAVYNFFSNVGTRDLPTELKNELKSDSEWQEVVRELWKNTLFGLKGNKIKQKMFNDKHPERKTYVMIPPIKVGGGDDVSEVRHLQERLTNAIKKYLKKYGIDKTGRKMIYK